MRAPDHQRVAHQVPEPAFQAADRQQVLGGARVVRGIGREGGQQAGGGVRPGAGGLEAIVRRRLQPDDAGQGILDGAPVRDARIPGVARVRFVRDQEQRRPLAHGETRQERRRVGRKVRAQQPLHEPDDRAPRAARERQRPVEEDEPAALGDLGREDRLGPSHGVLQPLHRRERRVLGDRVPLEHERDPPALARHLERRQD